VLTLRRLAALAVLAWVGRWAAMEVASWIGRHSPRGDPPKDSLRAPGHMPGPFDRP
jgi:hypothetical protein